MAVYHKKYRNTGLHAFGQDYAIDADGLLTPEPSAEAAAKLAQLPNYRVEESPKAKPAPKPAPKAKPAPELAPEKEESAKETEAAPAPKRRRTRRKTAKAE